MSGVTHPPSSHILGITVRLIEASLDSPPQTHRLKWWPQFWRVKNPPAVVCESHRQPLFRTPSPCDNSSWLQKHLRNRGRHNLGVWRRGDVMRNVHKCRRRQTTLEISAAPSNAVINGDWGPSGLSGVCQTGCSPVMS